MGSILRRLSLGVILIVLASVLLLSFPTGPKGMPRVAILQHASTEVLDDGVRGMIDGLAEKGFVDGQTLLLRRFNAEGDLSTANTIARELISEDYALVLTSSTPSMQAVANANRDGKVVHVFGLVADPFAAGIGLNREKPLDHPRHITGLGTFVRVKDTFELARRLFPGLRAVGVVWNAGESNSLGFTRKAREACKELGIELIEATIDNSSGITEAANAVIARGAQALWVGGDNTVMMGLDALLAVARKGRVPVFSILPGKPDRGTLFDVGVDFYEVGRLTGEIAADILRGTDPATIPVRDVTDLVPRRVIVNTLALNGSSDPWRIPPEVLREADIVVDDKGIHRR